MGNIRERNPAADPLHARQPWFMAPERVGLSTRIESLKLSQRSTARPGVGIVL